MFYYFARLFRFICKFVINRRSYTFRSALNTVEYGLTVVSDAFRRKLLGYTVRKALRWSEALFGLRFYTFWCKFDGDLTLKHLDWSLIGLLKHSNGQYGPNLLWNAFVFASHIFSMSFYRSILFSCVHFGVLRLEYQCRWWRTVSIPVPTSEELPNRMEGLKMTKSLKNRTLSLWECRVWSAFYWNLRHRFGG